MAFSLESERPTAAAIPVNPLRALFAWIAEMHARHARRVALSQLLDLDAALLDDLGIDRQVVVEALQRPSADAGRLLTARRARSSRDWLSHPWAPASRSGTAPDHALPDAAANPRTGTAGPIS